MEVGGFKNGRNELKVKKKRMFFSIFDFKNYVENVISMKYNMKEAREIFEMNFK